MRRTDSSTASIADSPKRSMLHTLGGQPGEECLLLLGPVDNGSAGRFGDLDPIRDAPTLSLLLSRFARSTPDRTSVSSDSTAGGGHRGRNLSRAGIFQGVEPNAASALTSQL